MRAGADLGVVRGALVGILAVGRSSTFSNVLVYCAGKSSSRSANQREIAVS